MPNLQAALDHYGAMDAELAGLDALTRIWAERSGDDDPRLHAAVVGAMDAGATLADLERACPER